ncbi:MAG: DUF2924 domain-containing protein [Archangium sp.]|nr:DUF2924 domain-containing protein [Archangium sp.]
MTKTKTAVRARAAARAMGDDDGEVEALAAMSVPDLAQRHLELYGEPTHSRNRQYLVKRLTWRVQELREGGLPQGALDLIAQHGDTLPERWRMRLAGPQPTPVPTVPRDPRLPPVGTTLRRVHGGASHEVRVCAEGFDYQGKRFKTLSAIARRITGTAWNGFFFFGLKKGATT